MRSSMEVPVGAGEICVTVIRSGRKTGIIPNLKVEFIEARKNNYMKGKVPA